MNKDLEAKKALNTEEMDQVFGGTAEEFFAYLERMNEKYGNYSLMTPEEKEIAKKWAHHHPGEPNPE